MACVDPRNWSVCLGLSVLLAAVPRVAAAEGELAPDSSEPEPDFQAAPLGAEPAEPIPEAWGPPKPEPPAGKHMFRAGVFGVSFGVLNLAGSVPLYIVGPGHANFTGVITFSFGTLFTTLGALGIHYGKRRRKVWRAWEADPRAPILVPEKASMPGHKIWLTVGGVTAGLGLATMAYGIPAFGDPILNTPPFAYVCVAWGSVSAAAGMAMLSVGGVQAHRRKHGRRHRAGLQPELAPFGWADGTSLQVGLAGRF